MTINVKSIFIVFVFLTSGCESNKNTKLLQQSEDIKSTSISGDRLNDIEKIERCRRELEALKKIDSVVYNKRKAEFDKLILGASIYNGVRSNVDNYTQGAVDALYLFRSDKLCADISSDVLDLLSK